MTAVEDPGLRVRRERLQSRLIEAQRLLRGLVDEATDLMAGLGVTVPIEQARREASLAFQELRDIIRRTCDHPADSYRDADPCPDPCGVVHTRCRACGHALDRCPFEEMP